jgi:hypothetical protein
MALEITVGCSICVLIHPCEVHKSWVPAYVGDRTLYVDVQYFQHNYCTSLASSHLSGVLNLEVASGQFVNPGIHNYNSAFHLFMLFSLHTLITSLDIRGKNRF